MEGWRAEKKSAPENKGKSCQNKWQNMKLVKHKVNESSSRKKGQKKKAWQCLEIDGGEYQTLELIRDFY